MEGQVTLYLEGWQRRMLTDFAGLRGVEAKTKITIKPGKKICLASYKIPPDGMRKGDWQIYLTDSQMLQVKKELGLRTPISSVNVNKEALDKGVIVFG